jgi:hypothetical protein
MEVDRVTGLLGFSQRSGKTGASSGTATGLASCDGPAGQQLQEEKVMRFDDPRLRTRDAA